MARAVIPKRAALRTGVEPDGPRFRVDRSAVHRGSASHHRIVVEQAAHQAQGPTGLGDAASRHPPAQHGAYDVGELDVESGQVPRGGDGEVTGAPLGVDGDPRGQGGGIQDDAVLDRVHAGQPEQGALGGGGKGGQGREVRRQGGAATSEWTPPRALAAWVVASVPATVKTTVPLQRVPEVQAVR